MTRSMTAFARQESEHEWGSIVWEIRSVNHRYLEPHARLPDSFRDIENKVRDKLRQSLSRGKVECTLRFTPTDKVASLTVNQDIASELLGALQSIRALDEPAFAQVNPLDALRWPGVLQDAKVDPIEVRNAIMALFDKALSDLVEGRMREGKQLKQHIEQRVNAIADVVTDVRARMPLILENQRANLVGKLAELKVELDPTRLEQEIVLLAQKADVAEELDRLDTHLGEVGRVLKQKGPIGRRLDFLMQELNREANTLSSKSIVSETTQSAVDLKVYIEQMREQIQNIE
ncbi:MAG: YicC/YloC family endoribonuclease [Pontibacterium sp.]